MGFLTFIQYRKAKVNPRAVKGYGNSSGLTSFDSL